MNRLFELSLLCAGIFLGAVDQTVVVTALPAMIRDLRIPITQLDRASWIVTAYLLGYTAAMPLAGRLADVLGPRRAYLCSLLLFAAGSVGCAVAPGLWTLVAARALQAAGGGALVPAALSAVGRPVSGRVAGAALGAVAAVAEGGSVLGPLYGAWLTEWFGWRAVFWTNLPLVALIGAGLVAPGLLARRAGAARAVGAAGLAGAAGTARTPALPLREVWRTARHQVDWTGAALAALGLAALTLGLTDEARQPRPAALTAALLALAALLLTLFVQHERRTANPLLDVRLFRHRAFSAANAASLLGGAALIVPMVNVPLWAQTIAGQSTLDSGWLLLRLTAPIPAGALAGGWLTRWRGPRVPLALGLVAAAAGLALMAQWSAAPSDLRLTRDLALAGLGFGLLIPPLTTAAIVTAGEAYAGAGAALVTVSRMIGMMVGLSALTSWGLRRFDTLVRPVAFPVPQIGEAAPAYQARLAEYQQHVTGATLAVFHEVLLAAAAVALCGLIPALWVRLRAPAAVPPEAPPAAALHGPEPVP